MRYVSRTWGLFPAIYMVMGVGVAAATEGLGHAATEERGHATVAGDAEPSVTVQAAAMAGGAAGAIIHVDAGATGGNDGSSWCDAYRNPQDALSAATPGDTILVAQGTYMPDGGYTPVGGTHIPGGADRTATFRLVSGVTLQGGYAGCGQPDPNERDVNAFETILSGDLSGNDVLVACTQDSNCSAFGALCSDDGFCIIADNNDENSYHVVTGSGTDRSAILDGFTITVGNANGSFPRNRGGGMFNETGSPMVANCTFSGNSAGVGGGMYNTEFSSPTVTNCTFSGNSATDSGGGMYNFSSDPTVITCTFTGNSADWGGGMYNNSSGPAVTNCTFSGNSATDSGGGMVNVQSNPTVTNCTFSGNSVTDSGGGMLNTSSSNPTVTNCILWGNSDSGGVDESAQIHTTSGTPTVNYSIVQGGWIGAGGVGVVDADPLFVDADGPDDVSGTEDDDLRLVPGSPAIDAGSNAAVPPDVGDLDGDRHTVEPTSLDLGGNPRFVDDPESPDCPHGGDCGAAPIVDMGAFEFQLPCEEDANCDDGSFCTGSEMCVDGFCQSDQNPCPEQLCDEAGGVCRDIPPILFVDDDAPPGGIGTSWATAFNHLQDALWLAQDDVVESIWVAGGIYTPDQGASQFPGYRTATFQLRSGVALYGGLAGNEDPQTFDLGDRDFQANETLLSGDLSGDDAPVACTQDRPDCNSWGERCADDGFCIIADNNDENSYHVVTGSGTDGSAILDGFTITAGNANGAFPNNGGGGMYNGSSSNPTVTNCTFNGNSASFGGGMYNFRSDPTVITCTFSGNSANRGGGMYNSNSDPIVTNCTFSGNSANSRGGGMYNDGSSPTVTNCTFSGNSASDDGGAIFNNASGPTVTNCTFSGNSVTDSGGGMYNRSSSATVTNCTFSDNSASENGGGMFNDSSSNPAVTNCTFRDNSAANYGGGMYNNNSSHRPTVTDCTFIGNSAVLDGGGMYNNGGSPAMTNCTFSGNSATDFGGGMYNNGGSPAMTNCTFSGNSATDSGGGMYNFSSDPTVITCTFTGNSADRGGGMYNNSGTPKVTNGTFGGNSANRGGGMYNFRGDPTVTTCTFSGNSANAAGGVALGGGMFNDNSSPAVTNCTFTGNSSTEFGGGMLNLNDSSPTVTNCILWGNLPTQIVTFSGTPVVNYSIIQDGWIGPGGVGVVDADPLLVDPDGPDNVFGTEDDDVRLMPGSPAIDAGNNAAVPLDVGDLDDDDDTAEPTPLDLDGNPRFADVPGSPDCPHGGDCGAAPIVDMGAFEFQRPCEGDADCDDGLFCTGSEMCIDGFCQPGLTPCPRQFCDEGSDVCMDIPPILLFVDAGATGRNDGSSWCDAFRNPQDALIAAMPGDTIVVAQGTYMPDGGFTPIGRTHVPSDADRTATFQLVSGVTLQGGYAGCGQPNPNERDVDVFESILSGDLVGDDTLVACTQDSDCGAFGALCADDGFCIIADNDDENSYHVVTGSGTDGSAILDGFTITAGNADGADPNDLGGGMFNTGGGSPTVTDCTFSGNSATDSGGGMYNTGFSNPTVTDCVFNGNSANRGGGMYNSSSNPAVTNCTFSGNAASLGGGICNGGSSPAVINCTFSGNAANASGGGMFNGDDSSPTVTDCTFSGNAANSQFSGGGGMFNGTGSPAVTNCTFGGNSANRGGGMYNASSSSPTVTDCAFSDNSVFLDGGGMYNSDSSPTVTNCTFSGNSADRGGGMFNNFSSSPAVINCILWGNDDFGGMDESAQIHTDSGTPTVNYSIVQGGWIGAGGVGVADADPLFVDADGPDDVAGTEDDDLRLMPGSPGIDAGSNAAVPPDVRDLDGDGDTGEPTPLDRDGNPRFVDDLESPDCPHGGDCGTAPVVDMGAFEFFCAFSGDSDGDADIDLDDFLEFLDCAADAPAPACTDFDADCDGDVNLFDFGSFQRAFTGP